MAANIIAGVSLAILVLKALVLNQMPAVFDGAEEVGGLVDSILTSIVASYVFFVIVVHWPNARDRMLVRAHVDRHSEEVVRICRRQLDALAGATGITLDFESLSPEELRRAFLATRPNGESPLSFAPSFKKAVWIDYLVYHVGESLASSARVLSKVQYVDARLVQLLTSIEDCTYFLQVQAAGSSPIKNKDLDFLADPFIKYCALCKELHIYRLEALTPNVP